MKLVSAVLGIALLTSCAPAVKTIVFAVDPHWPPMESLDAAKQPTGYDIDLVKALGTAGGFVPRFRSVAWDELFAGLDAGDYDAVASAVLINDARRAKYDFSDPYLNAGQVLVVPKGSAAVRLEDLKGRPIGVQTGTVGAQTAALVLGRAARLKTYNAIDLAFADLAAGRVAGVVTETPVAAQYTLGNRRYNQAFKVVGTPLTTENYGLVVKKGNAALLKALNEALAKVRGEGTLEKLSASWLR